MPAKVRHEAGKTGLCLIQRDARQDQGKFIPAQSCGNIRLAKAIAQADSETPQNRISRQMAMPVMVLGLANAAAISRYMRSSMLDNMKQDYVRTARAKGMSERTVVLKHVLRNSMIPVVTIIALGIPSIFGGAIITENLFGVSGIGAALIGAIHANDLPMVQTLAFIFAILIVSFTLIADVHYGLLDPRIRYD